MAAADIEIHLRAKPGKQTIDEAAIAALARSPAVQADIHRRAERVAAYQRSHVGVKTGKLLSTIRIEDASPSVDITAGRAGSTPQLGYQIYGTSPHVITPRGNGHLVFYWKKAGKVVSLKRVNHPGTRANRFVQESLAAAAG